MRRPRGLTPEEAELWRKLASTVTPLLPPRLLEANRHEAAVEEHARGRPTEPKQAASIARRGSPVIPSVLVPSPRSGNGAHPLDRHGLDAGWERNLSRGLVEPDFTLDLHGASLDAAHGRLANGLAQAKAMRARVVLLITGRPRPVEAADRGHARGAIRAKVIDWIAAGEHASDIAAIRGAHRRHGGAGALYVILRRRR